MVNPDTRKSEEIKKDLKTREVEALEKSAAANDKMVKKLDDLNDKINKLTLAIGKLKEAVSKSAGRR